MADAYLNVAESVILRARRPLRPREIVLQAQADGLLPWHLHGPRQDKTLHARLSVDVARQDEDGRFFRTGPGIFFLRALLDDADIPDSFKEVYYAPPRRKDLRRERVLTLEQAIYIACETDGFVSLSAFEHELKNGAFRYSRYEDLVRDDALTMVYSFVLVFTENAVLSFRSGRFRPESDPLVGRRSIGLGGPVYDSHVDLLFRSLHGIIASGIDELGYGIGLPRRLAERARYQGEVRPQCCRLVPRDGTKPGVLQAILAFRCPADFSPTKAALSVNDLRWLDIDNPANTLDDFDTTSRELFVSGRLRKISQGLRLAAD